MSKYTLPFPASYALFNVVCVCVRLPLCDKLPSFTGLPKKAILLEGLQFRDLISLPSVITTWRQYKLLVDAVLRDFVL
jgi:hypothetical protein